MCVKIVNSSIYETFIYAVVRHLLILTAKNANANEFLIKQNQEQTNKSIYKKTEF